jgi:excisionase family DNA binding protein
VLTATDDRLSAGEAARRLGRSKQRVLQLIQSGDLSATRTMIGYLIDADDVEALRQKREHRTSQDRVAVS